MLIVWIWNREEQILSTVVSLPWHLRLQSNIRVWSCPETAWSRGTRWYEPKTSRCITSLSVQQLTEVRVQVTNLTWSSGEADCLTHRRESLWSFGPLVLWCYDVTVRLQLIGSQQTCSKDVSAFVSCLHWRWMTLLIYTAKHILFLSCYGWTSGSCQTPRRPLPTDDRFTPRRIFRIVLWAASSSEKGLQRKAATTLSPSTPSLTQRSHQSPPASDPSSFLETICHSSSGADTILKRSTNLCVISSSQLIGGC